MATQTASAWDRLGTSVIDGAQQAISNSIANAASKKQQAQPAPAFVQVQGASMPSWMMGAGVGVVALIGFILLKRKM